MTIYDYLKELEAVPLHDAAGSITPKGGDAAIQAVAVRRCIKILEKPPEPQKSLPADFQAVLKDNLDDLLIKT
jgi:hypothetical protein